MQLGQGAELGWFARRQPLFAVQPAKTELASPLPLGQTVMVGKTKTGIVTIQVLNINNPARVMLQEYLLFEGRFPPEV
jgi:hypothetical protein